MVDTGATLFVLDGFRVQRDGVLAIEEQGRMLECRLPERTVRYLLDSIRSATFRGLHPEPVGFTAGGKDWGLSIGYKAPPDLMGMALGRKRPYVIAITAGDQEAVVTLPEASEGLKPGLVEMAMQALADWDTVSAPGCEDPSHGKAFAVTAGTFTAGTPSLGPGLDEGEGPYKGRVSAHNGLPLTEDEREIEVIGIRGRPKLGTLSEELQLAILRQAAAIERRAATPAGRAFQASARVILARLEEAEASGSAEEE